ncbi:MAG TPA: hypothetical protein VE954_24140 [Oligoflexus sp.]|uniref:hypothetical protein n=1 Tax=Oligoflexus sp. TaxID=1971216 RepID=UPI002D33181F|nr:hypothetical protein [Oligoflexus sp.]HYX36205.1 hypothetical protein [Oligoflexus sp.]
MKFKQFHVQLQIVIPMILFAPLALANETAILFGLGQPILFNGYNVELNYLTENLVFEYSHGWNLNISNFKDALTEEEKKQDLDILTPFSTGGGIGYRFTDLFHAALEYKVHEFEVSSPTVAEFSYRTQTLGVGLYYNWKPFEDSGFTVVSALRYWPTIATSLENDEKILSNGRVHKAHGFDVAPNVKIGWTF